MESGESQIDEALLHRAVLRGDELAWKALYDQNWQPLCRYVAWRCAGVSDLTDETLQDAWMTAVRRIRHFDPQRGTFQAWLRGIAANALRNRLRNLNGHVTLGEEFESNGRTASTESSRPEAALQQAEKRRQVIRALDRLPEHYEAVLRAKYVDELPVAEIARRRSETPKAVESLLSRARAALRDELRGRI